MSDKEYNLHVLQGASREAYGHPPNLFERYALDLRDARRELAVARGLLPDKCEVTFIVNALKRYRQPYMETSPDVYFWRLIEKLQSIDAFLGGEGEG